MESIGPYELIRPLGEGGMGIVYEARQENPVKRTVALKVIKAGMDTKQVVARFEAERQALALMDHPGIAKVLDGGETAEGRPYFVMECVEGEALDTFLREHALDLDQKLHLFTAIGRAMEHAHQKGVIHRDLKPSNILIVDTDGAPQPRIIDFGIAKAVSGDGQLTEKTLLTSYAQVLGTPAYMSPEQLDVSGSDLDTRTDIYGLGVILYEMLTGKLPFDKERLSKASLSELEAILCEEDPPRPSKRTGSASLKGDLDWIVMKALEKDPTKRYDSAGAFVADIERFLRDEPVTAAAPTTRYLVGKFARRHRGALAFATSIVLLLAAGTVISSVLALRAQRQAARAEATLSFLQEDVLRVGDPFFDGHNLDTKLGEVMERAQTKLEGRFEDEPEIKLELLLTILRVYSTTGQFPQVLSVCDLGKPLIETLGLQHKEEGYYFEYQRGYAYFKLRDYQKALAVFETLVPSVQRDLGLEANTSHLATIFLARTLTFLRRYDEAEKINRDYLAYLEGVGKGDQRQAILTHDGIASNYMNSGRPAKALPHYLRCEALIIALGRTSTPYYATVQHNIGACYANQGLFEKAFPILVASMEKHEQLMGRDSYDTMNKRHDLAGAYWEIGNQTKAIATAKEAWDDRARVLGPHARETLESWHRYAEMLVNDGQVEAGTAEAPKLLPLAHQVFGDSHAITNWCLENAPSREAAMEMVRQLQGLHPWPREATVTLLPRGSQWHYHSDGTAPPSDWQDDTFEPTTWQQGKAPLGYGESDIAETISFGEDADAKHAAAYFHTRFTYDGEALSTARLRVRRDDGLVISLNGQEIARHHLPAAHETDATTFAVREVGGIEERLYYCLEIDPSLLKPTNVLTAQVHQCNGKSSDLVFDLSVEGLLASNDAK